MDKKKSSGTRNLRSKGYIKLLAALVKSLVGKHEKQRDSDEKGSLFIDW